MVAVPSVILDLIHPESIAQSSDPRKDLTLGPNVRWIRS